ncbi:membrane anchor subunit of succinate dehydrogenase, Sdh4 [Tulasnella sp. 418]|nr:membrane anchor subunit of succinate dehydrogenase, Sdh4 [Tulasnella sp. 418]
MSSTALIRQSLRAGRCLNTRPLILVARLHSAKPLKASAQVPEIGSETYPYVPGGPVLPGTVNDATKFPPPNKSHGSYHWAFERLLSASLVPITAASMALSSSPYPVLDGILAISLVVHSHIGFDAMLVDYVHERKHPKSGVLAKWGLRAATATVLVGVYQFNTTDVGLTELIKRVWNA